MHPILAANKLNLFKDGLLKPHTDTVWTTICDQLGNKVIPKCLYIDVFKDRHNYQTNYKQSMITFSTNIENENDL